MLPQAPFAKRSSAPYADVLSSTVEVSVKEFLALCKNPNYIVEDATFMVPKLGDKGFGSFRVVYSENYLIDIVPQ